MIIVWDNFESAEENLTAEDRAELGRFLDVIRGMRGKVIITSRSREEWLKPSQRFELPLRGLDGEERWEYCDAILRELGLKVNRNDPELSKLMDQLAGHPLAMRVVLPKLEQMPAAKISEALRNNIAALGLNEQEEQGRLFATLRFVEQGLPKNLRPLMSLVGLHESYVSPHLLELMAKQVDIGWTRPLIDRLMAALAVAGLVRDIGSATFEMHPLLTSYLRSRGAASGPCQRAFVDVMGRLANNLGPREYHEQRVPFLLHGADFHFALQLSKSLSRDQDFAALTQSLAHYAQNSRNFVEASRVYGQLAQHYAAREGLEGEATAYHQLGRIAEEQRDFETAREWYLKSLAISEEQGRPRGAAMTYHQLGRIAQEQREFDQANEWYLKSLAIEENRGNPPGIARALHVLGSVALRQGALEKARELYLKSLAISEKQGNLHPAAMTYHQLGRVAEEQRDLERASEWYLKSLAIKEMQGNIDGAAMTYGQMGIIAQERRDFEKAREWYLKSLAIDEKQGDLHGAACTYGNLAILARTQGSLVEGGRWALRSIANFSKVGDQHSAALNLKNFLILYDGASADDKQKLEAAWHEAGLGPFPTEPN